MVQWTPHRTVEPGVVNTIGKLFSLKVCQRLPVFPSSPLQSYIFFEGQTLHFTKPKPVHLVAHQGTLPEITIVLEHPWPVFYHIHSSQCCLSHLGCVLEKRAPTNSTFPPFWYPQGGGGVLVYFCISISQVCNRTFLESDNSFQVMVIYNITFYFIMLSHGIF